MTDLVEQTLRRYQGLEAEALNFMPLWKDCTDYVLPRKNDVYGSSTPGERKTSKVFDGTAIRGNRILAAALHGQLSNPARPWFRVGLLDRDRAKYGPHKEWLWRLQRLYYDVFRRSNFYSEIHEAYLDLGSVGTPIVYMPEDPHTLVRFLTLHVSRCRLADDPAGRIRTLYREYEISAENALKTWGDRIGRDLVQTAREKPHSKIPILQAIEPRPERDTRKADNRNLPFRSLNIALSPKLLVAESGFHEWPFAITRWSKSSGETYGRSPASDVLSDILSANNVRKTMLKARHKAVDPALFLPDRGFTGGSVNLSPGSVNFYRVGKGDIVAAPQGKLSAGNEELAAAQAAINRGFYVDLFLAILQKPNMTATEVVEIGEEKLILLGPTLERLLTGFFTPAFERVHGLLSRAGRIPPAPPDLQGQEIEIEYISPLAMAMRMTEAVGIQKTYQFAFAVREEAPEVMDNLDHDKNLRTMAELYGMPMDNLVPMENVKKARQARQQAFDQEIEKEDAERMAGALRNVAKAGKDMRPQ